MEASVREIPEFELALLKRSVDELVAGRERCGRCNRSPLIGEQVYVYGSGAILCELCRSVERATPIASRVVHGPEFGHTMPISDRRAAPRTRTAAQRPRPAASGTRPVA
jgi:hypothetical protein